MASGGDMLICTICDGDEPLLSGNLAVLANSCGHVFHGKCMENWISKLAKTTSSEIPLREFKGTCPICYTEMCLKNCIRLYLNVDEDNVFGRQMLELKEHLKEAQAQIAKLELISGGYKPLGLPLPTPSLKTNQNQSLCSSLETRNVVTRSRAISSNATAKQNVLQRRQVSPKPQRATTTAATKLKPVLAQKLNSSALIIKRRSFVSPNPSRSTQRNSTGPTPTTSASTRTSVGNSINRRSPAFKNSSVFVPSASATIPSLVLPGPVTRSRSKLALNPTTLPTATVSRLNGNRTRIGV